MPCFPIPEIRSGSTLAAPTFTHTVSCCGKDEGNSPKTVKLKYSLLLPQPLTIPVPTFSSGLLDAEFSSFSCPFAFACAMVSHMNCFLTIIFIFYPGPSFYLPDKTENSDECFHSSSLLYLWSLVLLEGSMEDINSSHNRCAVSELRQAFDAGHQCFPLASCSL